MKWQGHTVCRDAMVTMVTRITCVTIATLLPLVTSFPGRHVYRRNNGWLYYASGWLSLWLRWLNGLYLLTCLGGLL